MLAAGSIPQKMQTVEVECRRLRAEDFRTFSANHREAEARGRVLCLDRGGNRKGTQSTSGRHLWLCLRRGIPRKRKHSILGGIHRSEHTLSGTLDRGMRP